MNRLEYYYNIGSKGVITPIKVVVNGETTFFSRESDEIDFSSLSKFRGSKIHFYCNGKYEGEYKFLGLIYKEGKIIGFNYENLDAEVELESN
jgi:hypothetical protein